MAYDIIYRKVFLSVGEEILPLVLSGSNNCTVGYGRYERRARDWNVLSIIPNRILCNKEDLQKEAAKEISGHDLNDYISSGLKIYNKPSTYNDLRGLFSSKSLIDCEEFFKLNHVRGVVYVFEDMTTGKGLTTFEKVLLTEEDVREFDEAYNKVRTNPNFKNVYPIFNMNENIRKPQKGNFILKDFRGDFLIKGLKRSVYLSSDEKEAKRFSSKRAALKACEKYKSYRFEVVELEDAV